jgi:hypothetical protein
MDAFRWITENHVGDLASIAGVAISVIGFVATIVNVRRSKSAAERAESAAREARSTIRTFEALSEFSAAIAIMEEIKRLHRVGHVDILPDRYSALRKVLIGVRRLIPSINNDLDTKLRSAITALATMENYVEGRISDKVPPDIPRLNSILSREIDGLQAALVDMTLASGGPS